MNRRAISGKRRHKRAAPVVFLSVVLLSGFWPGAAEESSGDFESLPALEAEEILAPDQVRGNHHRVLPEVQNDGYLNTYLVESEFGDFEVYGGSLLRARIREFEALAQLSELSRTEVFAKAAIEAGLSPVTAIAQFVRRPIKTITGIPRGIGRMFRRWGRSARQATDRKDESADNQGAEDGKDKGKDKKSEGLASRYLGVSDAEREWHRQFGTDPYTSNEVLAEVIKSLAWADRLGRFSLSFVPIPGIAGVGLIAKANDLVWTKDPYELEKHNRQVLSRIGADQDLVDEFYRNYWFSPTTQTMLVAAIEALDGVTGRQLVLRHALRADSEPGARSVLESTLMLASYHASQTKLERILGDTPFLAAVDAESTGVVSLAVDYLVWTEEVAAAVYRHMEAFDEAGAKRIEYWSGGAVSPRAREELSGRGWIVRTGLVEQMAPAQADSGTGPPAR